MGCLLDALTMLMDGRSRLGGSRWDEMVLGETRLWLETTAGLGCRYGLAMVMGWESGIEGMKGQDGSSGHDYIFMDGEVVHGSSMGGSWMDGKSTLGRGHWDVFTVQRSRPKAQAHSTKQNKMACPGGGMQPPGRLPPRVVKSQPCGHPDPTRLGNLACAP